MEPLQTEEQFRAVLRSGDANPPDREIPLIMQSVKRVIDTSDRFTNDDERMDALFRLTEYLNNFELEQTQNPDQPFRLCAAHRNLKSFIMYNDDRALHAYVINMYHKCLQSENDDRYKNWLQQFVNLFLRDNDNPADPNLHRNDRFNAADLALVCKERATQLVGFSGKWLMGNVLNVSQRFVSFDITTALDEALIAMGSQWGQFMTTMATSVGALGVIALYNLWCYHRGTKTLERAKKSFIDNGVGFVLGNAAGLAAQTVLTVIFGPLGFWLGLGVSLGVGAFVGMVTRHYVSKWTTNYYDIPKLQALEEAYKTLELPATASNNELSSQCRKLSRKYHPDTLQKNGTPTEIEIEEAVGNFYKIQSSYKLVKTMREAAEAGVDHNSNLTWKENFMYFVKNLIHLRRQDVAKEEELMKSIGFELVGFPPEETFEELPSNRDYDVDAPLTNVRIVVPSENVVHQWWHKLRILVQNDPHQM